MLPAGIAADPLPAVRAGRGPGVAAGRADRARAQSGTLRLRPGPPATRRSRERTSATCGSATRGSDFRGSGSFASWSGIGARTPIAEPARRLARGPGGFRRRAREERRHDPLPSGLRAGRGRRPRPDAPGAARSAEVRSAPERVAPGRRAAAGRCADAGRRPAPSLYSSPLPPADRSQLQRGTPMRHALPFGTPLCLLAGLLLACGGARDDEPRLMPAADAAADTAPAPAEGAPAAGASRCAGHRRRHRPLGEGHGRRAGRGRRKRAPS